MKSVFFASLILIFTSLYSCSFNCIKGNGVELTKTFQLQDFHGLSSSSAMDIMLIPSNEDKAVVTGDSNLIAAMSIDNSFGIVEADFGDFNCVSPKIPMSMKLYFSNELDKISINGSGDVESLAKLIFKELSVNINGSGSVTLNGDIEYLDVGIQGSGDVLIEGKGEDAKIGINGSGDVGLAHFELNEANVSVNGSGSVELLVKEELNASINGSGNVYYNGNAEVSASVNGSGKVLRAD